MTDFGEEGGSPAQRSPSPYDCKRWECSHKNLFITLGVFVGLVVSIIVIVPIATNTYSDVPFDSWGISYNLRSGEIQQNVLDPGRHPNGLCCSIHKFPRFDIFYDFSDSDKLQLKVRDGLEIGIDISLQVSMPRRNIIGIYQGYKLTFEETIVNYIKGELKTVATKYVSASFFSNRTVIEEDMRQSVGALLAEAGAELKGFFVRQLYLPTSIEQQLRSIELRELERKVQAASDALDYKTATNGAEIKRIEDLTFFQNTELTVETDLQVLNITRQREYWEELLVQEVARATAERNSNLTVLNKRANGEVLEIGLAKTAIQEETKREVEKVEYTSIVALNLYNQETLSLDLSLQKNLTVLEQETARLVAEYRAETETLLRVREQAMALELVETEEKLNQIVEVAKQQAAQEERSAFAKAYSGLPADVFLWKYMVDATAKKADLMDVEAPAIANLLMTTTQTSPTVPPTSMPTALPTTAPTSFPTGAPTVPTATPTAAPTLSPTTATPTTATPSATPTAAPTAAPTTT